MFSGRAEQAFATAKEALAADGSAATPLLVIGTIAAEHRNFAQALPLAELALQREASAWGHALKGRALMAMHRLGEARQEARAADALPTDRPDVADMVGVLLARTGLHGLARRHFQRCVEQSAGRASFLYNLATTLQFTGDLDGAGRHYRELLRIEPAHHRARLALVELERQTPDHNQVDQLERLFAAARTPDEAALSGHAIAKSREDMGEWDASFTWLERAKAEKAKTSSFDRAALDQLVAAAEDSIPVSAEARGREHDAPIFIVGMPRSGTTLVERIVGSHSTVESAGELSDFAVAMKREAATPGPLVLDAATVGAASSIDLDAVGRAYVASARAVAETMPRFIDKMPFNLFFVPAILAALPNAKVICVRRDPVDTLLSNFRQIFATEFPYYDYAFRLEDTAAMIAAFNRLADSYRAGITPSRYMEVRYEEVVTEQERSTHRLLEFCGLAFEEACLAPHRNTSPVATASSIQVRRPVYATSIGRWRRYGDAKSRMIAALGAEGLEVTA